MSLEVFYSYSHHDEELRDALEKHLSILKRNGQIVGWHDRRIGAGDEWRNQIDEHVRSAHIILLLISSDFLASDYCYDIEMKLALERHQRGKAIVIPIILRPVEWHEAPFARLQALPRDGKPVTKWADRDEAFADIARNIGETVKRFQLQTLPKAGETAAEAQTEVFQATPVLTPAPVLADLYVPKPRVVDAAIPSHIVKDLGTQLLVLIRLPDSRGLQGVLQGDEESEARPEDVRSKPFNMIFPLGVNGKPEPLKATVVLTSPDFSPAKQSKNVFVPPDADSDVVPFLLTPTRIGKLTVLVELQWEDALRGHRSLQTQCVAEASAVPAEPKMNVVQMPVAV